MGSSSLSGFWQNIISDEIIHNKLESVMSVGDEEERAIALLSRALFLYIMEIKLDRDETVRASRSALLLVDGCASCREKFLNDKLVNNTVDDSAVQNTRLQSPNKKQRERCMANKVDIISQNLHSGRVSSNEITNSADMSDSDAQNSQVQSCDKRFKKAEHTVKEIDKISPNSSTSKTITGTTVDKREPMRVLDDDPCYSRPQKGNSPKKRKKLIHKETIVPETMDLADENCGGKSVQARCFNTQVFIPATLDMDDSIPVDSTIDIGVDCEEASKPTEKDVHILSSQVLPPHNRTPTKKRPGVVRLVHKSPVLGKGSFQKASTESNIGNQDISMMQVSKPQENDQNRNSMPDNRNTNPRNLKPNQDVVGKPSKDSLDKSIDSEDVMIVSKSHVILADNKTPTKHSPAVNNSPNESPVLCKGNQQRRNPASKPSVKLDLCKVFKQEDDKGEFSAPQSNDPNSKAESKLPHPSSMSGQSTPRSKYSPLTFTHNISDHFTSPSLLPLVKGSTSSAATASSPELLPQPLDTPKSGQLRKPQAAGRGKTAFPRSVSSLSSGTSSKRLSLRKHQTVNEKKLGVGDLCVGPPNPGKKVSYKQTRVDQLLNQQKSGAKSMDDVMQRERAFVDDEQALKLALQESLKTKALADMRRQQGNPATDDLEEDLVVWNSQPSTTTRSHSKSNSPPKKPGKDDSPIRLPNLRMSYQSPGKAEQKSPYKEQSRPLKRKILQAKNDVQEGVEELDHFENLKGSAKGRKDIKQKIKSSHGKSPLKKSKQDLFENSFDLVPQKEQEPSFAHQGEVVRKKVARRQLAGWGCKECADFFQKAGEDPEEVQAIMNKCSRHRSKYKPKPNTPDGFWNPEWED